MTDIYSVLKESLKDCTGCGACYNICPKNAIRMDLDENGFYRPYVDESLCIDCNLCVTKCPMLHPTYSNTHTPNFYAVWASDETRYKSSSGGVFSVFAENCIANNGVVYGAAWTSDWYIQHKSAETIEDLQPLLKSKYAQSNTADTFKEVKKHLSTGRPVLYCGLPCQIAGLNNFLGKDYPNLLTIDLLCSHVPPIGLYRKYLDETYGINNVKEIIFRDKRDGWNSHAQKITTTDGVVHLGDASNDWWQKAYHPKLMSRDICVNCQFARLSRQADITIGDFWFIWEKDPSWHDGKGTSVLMVNNQKGKAAFEQIKPMLKRFEEKPSEWGLNNRVACKNPCSPYRNRFMNLVKTHPFSKAVEMSKIDHFDIGIISIWSVPNYGTNLTYYALYQTIVDMGFSALMIERPSDIAWCTPTPQTPKKLPLFDTQVVPEYAISDIFPNQQAMKKLNWLCKSFVLGSDQLLNDSFYQLFNGYQNLNWVFDSKRKIAYSASFGNDTLEGPKRDAPSKAYFLRKFDAVSVREKSAVDIMKNIYGVNATHVLDPVFLCNPEYYENFAKSSKLNTSRPYISGYILDPSIPKANFLKKVSNSLGTLPIQVISDTPLSAEQLTDKWDIPPIIGASCEDWLGNIKNSELFVTDSFHGICFAIILKKNFIAINNAERGSARMRSILELCGITNRLISTSDLESITDLSSLLKPVDFDAVQKVLNIEINRCKDWLYHAITDNANEIKPATTYDILDFRFDIVQNATNSKINELYAKISELENRLSRYESEAKKNNI